MFKVQYDTHAPDAIIDADLFVEEGDFVSFTKDGEFVSAVRSINVLAIHQYHDPAAGPFARGV